MTSTDALRLAINALKDCAESNRMPSGIVLDSRTASLHAEAADELEEVLANLMDVE